MYATKTTVQTHSSSILFQLVNWHNYNQNTNGAFTTKFIQNIIVYQYSFRWCSTCYLFHPLIHSLCHQSHSWWNHIQFLTQVACKMVELYSCRHILMVIVYKYLTGQFRLNGEGWAYFAFSTYFSFQVILCSCLFSQYFAHNLAVFVIRNYFCGVSPAFNHAWLLYWSNS